MPLGPGEGEAEAAVALFMKDGLVTHVSRRRDDEWWESKLGPMLHILHHLRAIEDLRPEEDDLGRSEDMLGSYGRVVRFYRDQAGARRP